MTMSPDQPAPPAAAATTFTERLHARWSQGRVVCVGLDPVYERIPETIREGRSRAEAMLAFNTAIVDATSEWVCAFKPNAAFYEAEGIDGAVALAGTIAHIKRHHPSIPVIYDGKRGDIGDTNRKYATAAFDVLGADAATVHSYFGQGSLRPYLERADRGVVIMTSNSDPGAGEFQDLPIGDAREPLYQVVARSRGHPVERERQLRPRRRRAVPGQDRDRAAGSPGAATPDPWDRRAGRGSRPRDRRRTRPSRRGHDRQLLAVDPVRIIGSGLRRGGVCGSPSPERRDRRRPLTQASDYRGTTASSSGSSFTLSCSCGSVRARTHTQGSSVVFTGMCGMLAGM